MIQRGHIWARNGGQLWKRFDSRMLFVRAYPRETQEMVFDAHDRAFAFFKGACTRGIYDNLKAAVDAIFVGRERAYNRRFLQMCSHYLVDPVACTPASGWEKGQVENQVGLVRERFFSPRLRIKSYDELNAWLLDQCVAYARAHRRTGRRFAAWPSAALGRWLCRLFAGRLVGQSRRRSGWLVEGGGSLAALPHADARTAAVFVDELDSGGL